MTNRTCLILDFSKDLDELLVMTIIQSTPMLLSAVVKPTAVAMMMMVQRNKTIFYFAEDLD